MTTLFIIISVLVSVLISYWLVVNRKKVWANFKAAWQEETTGVWSMVKKWGYLILVVLIVIVQVTFVVLVIIEVVSRVMAWFK